MVQDKNPSQDTVQKGGHTAVLESVSYDKDVLEIEPADAIDSAHYGGSFVKDVCVDEGRRTRTASEENPLDRRSSPNFSRQVIGADSDIGYEKKGCSRVSVHGLKPDVVSPAGFAPHCNGKECGLEDGIDVAAGESSEKKVSLQELLLFESAGESGRSGTVNSESCGKCRCPLHEDAAGQTSKDGDPDVLQTEPGDAYGRRNQETPGHTDQEHSIGSTDDDSSKPAAARVGDEDTYDHEPDLSGRGGPVSVSGRHPACSGSVSLRSDSSARSFAFPVLQGEWTGSPVRMAKAERRHSGRRRRRRRAWRKGIICCKF